MRTRGAIAALMLVLVTTTDNAALAENPSAHIEKEQRAAACQASAVQEKAELQALSLMKTPEVREAMAEAARKWRNSAGHVSPEMDALFASSFEELAFGAILRTIAVSLDPPAIISTFNLPHRRAGRRIPGSRFGWDNPDVIYGKIGIDPQASYVITGWLPRRDMQVNLSLANANDEIVRNVSLKDIVTDEQGRFRITLGPVAQSPSVNHIPADPSVAGITLRETLADWRTDRPVYMQIVKAGGSPRSMASQELARRAARTISDMTDDIVRWRPSLYTNRPANEIRKPFYPSDKQGLPNQAHALGHFKLADDEALIVDVKLGGARYFTIPVSNIWGVTGDYRKATSTFNHTQTDANPDGTFTYVVSPADPGIYNWISTNGWHEGDLTLRWQELANAPGQGEGPGVSTRLVKLSELAEILPAHVKRVTPAERAAQIADRMRYPVGLWGADCTQQ